MNNLHVARLQRVLNKLTEVRLKKLASFGSEKHGYRLNPPLSEAEISAFEIKNHIQLPSDYREFLTFAGNGGAGPYYGIFPLDKWNDFAEWVLDEVPSDFLACLCLLQPGRNLLEDGAARYGDASPYQGTISIGSQGCTYGMQLVITGPYAGRVVYVDADGGPLYMVHEPDFLSWYERWLDELLQGYKIDWFGYGPGGGEEDFFQILNDPQASDEFKSEAAAALSRLPSLSDKGASRLVSFCHHSVSGVRAGACKAIRTFNVHQAEEEAARLLEDPSPDVRRQAVDAVMELDSERWSNLVLKRLRDEPDPDVAVSALYKLEEAAKFPKVELLKTIETSPHGDLRSYAAYCAKWTTDDVDFLLHMLSDSDSQVRRYAILGLQQIKAGSSLPQVRDLLARETDVNNVGFIIKTLGDFGDPAAVPTLLNLTKSADDFHRLDAIEALAKIGDKRALPIAEAMLQEHRRPTRPETGMSNVFTISQLVSKSLTASPNRAFRNLVRPSKIKLLFKKLFR